MRDIITNVHRSSCNPYSCQTFIKLAFSEKILKQSSIKFLENPSCSMQTDRHDKANSQFS